MTRRERFKQGLNSLYLPLYEFLCQELGEEWQPYYGLRTFTEQDQLWAQGRQKPGHIVTNARGGESAHNYGCASDWTIWEDDKPVWMAKDDPRWETYKNAVEKAGLKWGGDFGDVDHNELAIDCSWKHVLVAYGQGGMRKACEYIEERLKIK